ncbi:MAG TPA: hypothetical protein VND64_28335, partial [Pirellulales bacterium]|nr:hypothetical protein [Pirellulales bacterium]
FAWTVTNTSTAPTANDEAVTTLVNSAATFQLQGGDANDDAVTFQISTVRSKNWAGGKSRGNRVPARAAGGNLRRHAKCGEQLRGV